MPAPGRARPQSPSTTAYDASRPLIMTGTPGRLGITITGPSPSARTGAGANDARPISTTATKAATRDIEPIRSRTYRGILDQLSGARLNAAAELPDRLNWRLPHVAGAPPRDPFG